MFHPLSATKIGFFALDLFEVKIQGGCARVTKPVTYPQAGVGAYNPHTDEVTYKAYYQWVPFVLFLQGIMFYVPHLIFKSWEGGKVQGIVAGLNQVGILPKVLYR